MAGRALQEKARERERRHAVQRVRTRCAPLQPAVKLLLPPAVMS